MKWGKYKVDGDVVHGIHRHAADLYRWEIRVVGSDASGMPTMWGIWRDGVELLGKVSERTGRANQVKFERVHAAKAFVERTIVEELPEPGDRS